MRFSKNYKTAAISSQYVEMGLDLYNTYPTARAVFEEADKILGFPLMESAAAGLESYIALFRFADPDIPVVGNTAAQIINTAAAV